MIKRAQPNDLSGTKRKLVDAGMNLMRAQGFNATSVDEICSAAGVTKGGFFHYFKSKEELAAAALNHFHEGKVKDYEEAPFRGFADPLDRVFGRLDYVKGNVGGGSRHTKGCLIGVFAQELAFTNPALRDVCQKFFIKIADDFAADLAAAKAAHAPQAAFEPKDLALFYVSLIQGSLLLAKAADNSDIVAANIEQFRGFLRILFGINALPGAQGSTATASSLN
jgi:TetR/AcrR family transcriptional repressor of nem operon